MHEKVIPHAWLFVYQAYGFHSGSSPKWIHAPGAEGCGLLAAFLEKQRQYDRVVTIYAESKRAGEPSRFLDFHAMEIPVRFP
jgi:hypothetical protein